MPTLPPGPAGIGDLATDRWTILVENALTSIVKKMNNTTPWRRRVWRHAAKISKCLESTVGPRVGAMTLGAIRCPIPGHVLERFALPMRPHHKQEI
jgi:hypothetical protein